MIKNNKNGPTTLYLLNSKIKFQQQKKSARPSFNQKKTTRSISQFSKWGKQTSPFKHSKDNSSLKKIILSKNKYSMQPLDLCKKLQTINKIFQERSWYIKNTESSDSSKVTQCKNKDSINLKKDINSKSREYLIKDAMGNFSKDKSNLKTAKNYQSLLNTEYQQSIQTIVKKVEQKFNKYCLVTQDWRQKYIYEQVDLVLDEVITNFKSIFNQIFSIYNRQIISNIQYFQSQILSVAKDYEIQIQSLRRQIDQKQYQSSIIANMTFQINQLKNKGVFNSKIISQLSSEGIDIQSWVKNSNSFKESQTLFHTLNKKIQNLKYELNDRDKSVKNQRQMDSFDQQTVKMQNKKAKNDCSMNLNIGNIYKSSNQYKDKSDEYYKKLNSYR